jgi:hypothetical protein
MLKELSLEPFLICCCIGTHSSGCSPNVSLREEVAHGGGGGDASGRLSRDVIKGSSMGEHGLGVKVSGVGMVPREKGTPEGFWGVAEGLTNFSSPTREKHLIFTANELTICFAEARGGR